MKLFTDAIHAELAHPPGYLLVNTGNAAADPIDDVVKNLTGLSNPMPSGDVKTIERNRNTMIGRIAGSVREGQWDAPLVAGIVNRALPLLFLPHAATQPLKSVNGLGLNMIAVGLEAEIPMGRHEPAAIQRLRNDPWLNLCLIRLRQRLILFPLEYDFYVQHAIRQLNDWCLRLASMVTQKKPDQVARLPALHADLPRRKPGNTPTRHHEALVEVGM